MKIVVIGGTGLIGILRERTLLPGEGAMLFATRFEDWITQSVAR
jgi:hypothetical protein